MFASDSDRFTLLKEKSCYRSNVFSLIPSDPSIKVDMNPLLWSADCFASVFGTIRRSEQTYLFQSSQRLGGPFNRERLVRQAFGQMVTRGTVGHCPTSNKCAKQTLMNESTSPNDP